MNWKPLPQYAPDPTCPHDMLVDVLPKISNDERRDHFNATGEIILRLRQWECVECKGGSYHWPLSQGYHVDSERNVATRKIDLQPWETVRRRGGKHQRASGAWRP